MKTRTTLLHAFTLLYFFSFAQNPTLVSDFNEGNADGYNNFNFEGVYLGEEIIFPIVGKDIGEELAILKNGQLETLKDINPGVESSNPNNFVSFNGKIYFSAFDEINGGAIWSTDGTSEGTTLFYDPGTENNITPQGLIISNSGFLYFTFDERLYRTDGETTENIYTGIKFLTSYEQQANNYCLYNDEIAFLSSANNQLSVKKVENNEVITLGSPITTSNFADGFGISQVDKGLVFGIADDFEDSANGTYFYLEESQEIVKMTISGQTANGRRLVDISNKIDIAWIAGSGYYAINGENGSEELLFESDNTSFTQGDGIEHVSYGDNFIFDGTKGFWQDVFIIFSDGTANGSKELFEISEYKSNVIRMGKYAFIAINTSNGFKPELYAINMKEGSYEKLYDFLLPSNETNSILLLGTQNDKLYFLSNLDPEVGREMYSIDLNIDVTTSINIEEKLDFNVKFTSNSFEVSSPDQSDVSVKIYNTNGALLKKMYTQTNLPTNIKDLKGLVILQFNVNNKIRSFKFYGN